MSAGEDFYSVADTARMLRTPERTVRQAIARGSLAAIRPSPRETAIRWDDATAWQASRRSPEQRADRARRAAVARWRPDVVADDGDALPTVDRDAAAATLRLTQALTALAEQDQRPPCGDPAGGPLWTSDRLTDRAAAVRLCAGCPVSGECGAAADANGEKFGVWAGRDRTPMTPAQKRALTTKKAAA